MDFWSRLVGGVGVAPARKLASNNPQQRLARFKKTYDQTLQSWNKFTYSAQSGHILAEETLSAQLGRLTSLLHDDTRVSVPHLCLAFASSPDVFSTIGNIAIRAHNEQVALEVVAFFSTLVDNDEEGVLKSLAFSETLMAFVDHLISLSSAGRQAEILGEAFELLFGIAARIRLEPDILPAWFQSHNSSTPEFNGSSSPNADRDQSRNSREDFPLCHRFVGYVYNEGRVGDFARTGLLYIFETASSSLDLETWIVRSDLPTLMASGLGALYSQLSRKLTFAHALTKMPLILALSNFPDRVSSAPTESFHSPDLQSRLSTFLSYLHFWQDVLDYCRSTEIKSTLIGHFRVFFLEQILYPSLLESSDVDGGSSVAVQTYLWRILDAVKHPDLTTLILTYLLGAPDNEEPFHTVLKSSPVNTSKHILNANTPQGTSSGLDPSFFNLTDLILANVSSANPETQCAALRTISVLIKKHHHSTSKSLFTTTYARCPAQANSLGCLQRDICNMLDMTQTLNSGQGLDDAYEACLRDAITSIESHICYEEEEFEGRKRGPVMTWNDDSVKQRRSQLRSSMLNRGDPLLRALCKLLETFLQNEIEVNLGLTNVFTQLFSCPLLRLEGILTSKSAIQDLMGDDEPRDLDEVNFTGDLLHDEAENREFSRLEAYKQSRSLKNETSETPLLLSILMQLVRQIRGIREAIPNLTDFLANRKRALLGSIEIEREPPHPASPDPRQKSGDTIQVRPSTPQRSIQGRSDGFPTILHSPSRASSPATHRLGEESKSSVSHTHSRRGSGDSSSKTFRRQRQLSPLKSSLDPRDNESAEKESSNPTADEFLKARVRFNNNHDLQILGKDTFARDKKGQSLPYEDRSDSSRTLGLETNASNGQQSCSTSVHHVLTNIVILQEFILELAALVHTRASLLDNEIELSELRL